MPTYAARWVWSPDGFFGPAAVDLGPHGAVGAVRALPADAPVMAGALLPGFVNAHAHLELSTFRGKVPGGSGTVAWVEALRAAGLLPDPADAAAAAREAAATGTAALIDTTNRGDTEPHLRAAGLSGVVQIECLGLEPGRWAPALDAARARQGSRQVAVRPTAHAAISCAPALLRAALGTPASRGSGPAPTIHIDEDGADALLLGERAGPWAPFHAALGHDWAGLLPTGPSGVAVLDALGVLGPRLGLVHLVHTRPVDLDRVAASGAVAVLCPRSNLHIGGRLPDLPGLLRRGVPLALGTDSLASTPDMDLLAEAATLAAAFPAVPPTALVAALWGGAALLPTGHGRGAFTPGAHPGVLHVHLPPAAADPARALLDGTRWPRTWLP